MEAKKCRYCEAEIIGKRDDAKFCSNTCKAKHWEEKKPSLHQKEEKNVACQLRGVLNSNGNATTISEASNPPEPIFKTVGIPKYNPERLPFENQHKRLTVVKKQLDSEYQSLQTQLKQVTSSNGNGWIVSLTGAGAFVGNNSTKEKIKGTLLGAMFGFITGSIIRDATKNSRENDKKQQAEKIQQEIQNRIRLFQDADKELKIVENKLQAMPRFQTVQKQILTNTEVLKPLSGLQKDVSDASLTVINSDKIISSQQLKKLEFKALNFQGRWNILFGYPSTNFHCVIHGMSGEGKSTFAIQFAKYLADSIGRVIYISGEEGFSKTFKDKFSNNNAESKFLDVADLRSFDDIIREVPPESYNFIFIDSLDNMKIDADKMKKLREWYKNSSLITISQSTKDGKMRGSYEIVHDCDIAVKVENGIATTTKNRFKEKGMEFQVFPCAEKSVRKIIDELSNEI